MLIPFTDPVSKKQYLAQAEIERKFSVNGEKSLTGSVQLSDELIDKIDKRWTVRFKGESYVITYAKQIDNGEDKLLDFDATHEFFDAFGKQVVYDEVTGSHPFKWYLDTLFKNSGFNYLISVDVEAIEKENWGNKNKMSLFADLITSAGVEYQISGKTITITNQIGSDLSTIVRKGFNMQDFGVESDFSGFITYMEGYGAFKDPEDQSKGRLKVTYTSPLAKVYGKLEGEPKIDERYTIEENLLNDIKETVDNSIQISLDMTLEDLQAAGYNYAMAQPGDSIMIINELMDFKQKVRIVEVSENFDITGVKIGTTVTCGSLSMAEQQQAADAANDSLIDRIVNGKDKIPPSWLTDFIVQNSEALNNARSELKFTEQGIIAVDKNNANNLVIFNSAGIGVSTNGGKTYDNAITAKGINATAIVTGVLKGIEISGVHFTGQDMTLDNGLKITNVNKGIEGSYDFGSIDSLEPRWYQGDYSLSARLLRFLATQWNLDAKGNKIANSKAYIQAFYGPNIIKFREFDKEGGTMRSRLDASANYLQLSKSWADASAGSGVILYADGTIYGSSLEHVSSINTQTSLGINYANSGVYSDFNIGKDSTGARIWSASLYKRTYGSSANMVITSAGTIGRSTSGTKYKAVIEPEKVEASRLLQLEPKSWIDKRLVSRLSGVLKKEPTKKQIEYKFDREIGFIAEDLAGIGLEQFVIYDYKEDGTKEIEGIKYDRLTVPLLELAKEQHAKIEDLEARMKKLEEVVFNDH
ncbi:phage tail protein [Listeria grayi]|uniref:phage tail protein n=1 Tax=Listeria grayi TaxID=1641 RepID=UPI001625670C|nr:phage tail protein [Listeria grayi]MBC1921983.1 hypothetical protein [Listeria grayi]